jgi:acetolactate synthase I/II/III large subunit
VKVRAALAQCLADLGVEIVFGVLGAGNMYIMHELIERSSAKYVPAAREDGAVLMAGGWAAATGKLGVATVTYGGGITNSVTALVELERSSRPVLVVAGAHAVTRTMSGIETQQYVDAGHLVSAAGVEYRRVHSAESAVSEMRAAAHDALSESRPIVVGVPSDLQLADVEYVRAPALAIERTRRVRPDEAELDAAAGCVASARRPVIVAGRGAHLSGAGPAILELAEVIGAPVSTTLLAKGLFSGDPFDLGIFGGLSSEIASEVISGGDCIIVIGASLSHFTTLGGSLLEGKRIVHCDSSPAVLRRRRVDAAVVSDARLFADELARLLDGAHFEPGGYRSESLAARLASAEPGDEFIDRSDGVDGLDIRTTMIRLSRLLPAKRMVVTDGGRFVKTAFRYMDVPGAGAMIPSIGFAAIGTGLGCAVGVSFACPDRPTVLVTGDGGLLMCLADLVTAVEFGLDLIVIVMNDRMYGQEYQRFEQSGMSPDLARIPVPELASVAKAFGATGITIRTLAELELLQSDAWSASGTTLVDCRTDSRQSLGSLD